MLTYMIDFFHLKLFFKKLRKTDGSLTSNYITHVLTQNLHFKKCHLNKLV